eukprot:m.226511 g.226511  ORF g.226511 m.226511 type:complete len:416 (-) comp33493_c5_seq1:63-1310(-)
MPTVTYPLPCTCKQPSNEENATLFPTLTTKQLQALLNTAHTIPPELVVVDTRCTHAFNGWALDGEARGGHITGATVFSHSWLKSLHLQTNQQLLTELERFGITKDKLVVLYGYGVTTSRAVASKLILLGYPNVKIYADGFNSWAADPTLKVSRMSHFELLVHPAWVDNAIKTNTAKVFEVSWGNADTVGDDNYKKYLQSHIPNTPHIDTDEFEEKPLWNRKSKAEVIKAALANGITQHTCVVLYGTSTMAAARVALILKWVGVSDVRLLDGGFQCWVNDGFPVQSGLVRKTPISANAITTSALSFTAYSDIANENAVVADSVPTAISSDEARHDNVDLRNCNDFSPNNVPRTCNTHNNQRYPNAVAATTTTTTRTHTCSLFFLLPPFYHFLLAPFLSLLFLHTQHSFPSISPLTS